MSNPELERLRQEVLNRISDFAPFFSSLEKQHPVSGDWVSACCPFHEDGEPSFSFNAVTGAWKCFSGCGKGSIFDYLMRREDKPFKQVFEELCHQFAVEIPQKDDRPPIPEKMVESWCQCLEENEDVKRWLCEHRGFSLKTLRKYKIGWNPKKQRNTLPVYTPKGEIRNVRLYNAKKAQKMINYTDGTHKYGSPPRLYGLDELAKAKPGDMVILSEGEWDRLLLCQEGFLAVTGTHGAPTFRKEWVKYFSKLKVVIMYDTDAKGRRAVQNVVIPSFRDSDVEWLKVVWLPLEGTKDDKDVSDYFCKHDHTPADLMALIDATEPYVYTDPVEPEEQKPIELGSFTEIVEEQYVDKKVSVEITVSGQTSEDFHAVESFKTTYCPKMDKGGCFQCKAVNEFEKIPKNAQEFIGSCMTTNFQLKAMLREYACKFGQKTSIEIGDRSTIKEFFCHQRVQRRTQVKDETGDMVELMDGKRQELVEKRVYYQSHEHPKPTSYRATGWVKSHPKTQQITLLIDKLQQLEQDYETFDIKKQQVELEKFRAVEWHELLEDLNQNVTRIYDRDELLIGTLLTYCSPRWLRFNNDTIRGWLVTAIIGDAGVGKTLTTQRISDFVDLGDIFAGVTGSRTGLSYALVEHRQKGWQIKVGRYPANTRRLLIVDESQFISNEDMRTLSKAMEEGWLQIDRVQSQGYESQTRLILIANARRDMVMDSFSFGCEALKSVYPPTIIRRLDIALFASMSDLTDLSVINRANPAPHGRLVTSDMLRSVILWAWQLEANQIEYEPETEQMCLTIAEQMSVDYGYAQDVPLVTLSDFRNKLARLAAAFAVLWVSVRDDDYSKVFVKAEHVYAARDFVEAVYSRDNCSLNEYSEVIRQSTELVDYDLMKDVFLKKAHWDDKYANGDGKPFLRAIHHLRINDTIRRDELSEQSGCSKETIGRTVKLLKRFNLIDSDREGYSKRPRFNKFLRRLIREIPKLFEDIEENLDDILKEDPQYE